MLHNFSRRHLYYKVACVCLCVCSLTSPSVSRVYGADIFTRARGPTDITKEPIPSYVIHVKRPHQFLRMVRTYVRYERTYGTNAS